MTRTIRAEPILDARAYLAEGPLWDDRERVLYWVDVFAGELHRLDPSRLDDSAIDVGQPVGSLALDAGGGLVLALRDGFGRCDRAAGTVTLVAPVERELPGSLMNDGACDPAGRFWAGTMALDVTPGAGSLYRLDGDFAVTRCVRGVTASNGIDWSPDGRTMYYIDSFAFGVDAFAFDMASGTLGARRRVVDVAGGPAIVPDGMTVDADGCLWVALWGTGSVRRFTPDGRLDMIVEVPGTRLVTSCAFGGADLGDLFITSAIHQQDAAALRDQPHAGALFAARPGVTGRAANRFAAN